jgi:hypothetical protein
MIMRQFRIGCDEADCYRQTEDCSSLRYARQDAKKLGFIRRNGYDLCAVHKLFPCPVCGKVRVKRTGTQCEECCYGNEINRSVRK